MKILILDHYYPPFLAQFSKRHPQANTRSYQQQLKQLLAERFGTADFYSHALTQLGHPTQNIIVNYKRLQEQWAVENGMKNQNIFAKFYNHLWQKIPFLGSLKASPRQLVVIEAQVKAYQPDVLYIQIPTYFPTSFLRRLKKFTQLIVGQIAAPIPPWHFFAGFDLMITSLPHFVDKFKKMGLKSEYLPLCFDPRVMTIPPPKRLYPVTFVGSFFAMHGKWQFVLSQVAKITKLKIWGSPDPQLPCYQGEAWGRDMYSILEQSHLTLNRHSVVAGKFANNMRLFEATGCGALLLTDRKTNLADFFVEGQEIVSYTSSAELVRKIKYYLSHPRERGIIAKAGQQRTLKDHTYAVRMRQLITILEKYL